MIQEHCQFSGLPFSGLGGENFAFLISFVMGKKRGGKGGNESGGGDFSDQYGECGRSQDRNEFTPSKSFRGGGSAGGPSRTQTSITYHRQIPKFLQPYAHLIDKRKNPFDAPAAVENVDDGGSEEEDDDCQAVMFNAQNATFKFW